MNVPPSTTDDLPISLPPPTIVTEEEVMFFDTDCGAVVHNIAYLRFIETARTRLAAKMGLDLRTMSTSQVFPVVVRTEIDYRRAARLGDVLHIEGELDRLERVRFWCSFRILRPEDGETLITCRQSLALVQMPEARPLRLPEAWRSQWPELASSR